MSRLKMQFAPSFTNQMKRALKKHNIDLVFTTKNLKKNLDSIMDRWPVEEESETVVNYLYNISCGECDKILYWRWFSPLFFNRLFLLFVFCFLASCYVRPGALIKQS